MSFATSIGLPRRPFGIELIIDLFLFSGFVSITPGATLRTLTLYFASSLDKPTVKFSIAAFVGA